MRLTRMALLAGLLVVPAFLMTGCRDKTATRSTMNSDVENCKKILGAMKETWNTGKVAEGSEDGRLGLLAVILNTKMPYKINKRMTDPKRQVALAKAKDVNKFVEETLIPKFAVASKSKKPEDAKALIPVADQLDKLFDELDKTLD